MVLRGTAWGLVHARKFLGSFTPGIMIKSIEDATRNDIEGQIEKIVHDVPPLALVYAQGHAEKAGGLRYITGDRREDGALEGFTAEEMIKLFSKISVRTMSVVISDFCYSGNLYRLRYRLFVTLDGKGFRWLENSEWIEDNKNPRRHRINSPMFHISGALESQKVYETAARGGYLTNALANVKLESLPQFLLHLRQGVDSHMKKAKEHKSYPLPKDATQYPQIYCSFKLPLDDPEIFHKICQGKVQTPYSNIN